MSEMLYPQSTYCRHYILAKTSTNEKVLNLAISFCSQFSRANSPLKCWFRFGKHLSIHFHTSERVFLLQIIKSKYCTTHDWNWFASLLDVIYRTLIKTLSSFKIKALLSSSKGLGFYSYNSAFVTPSLGSTRSISINLGFVDPIGVLFLFRSRLVDYVVGCDSCVVGGSGITFGSVDTSLVNISPLVSHVASTCKIDHLCNMLDLLAWLDHLCQLLHLLSRWGPQNTQQHQ